MCVWVPQMHVTALGAPVALVSCGPLWPSLALFGPPHTSSLALRQWIWRLLVVAPVMGDGRQMVLDAFCGGCQ